MRLSHWIPTLSLLMTVACSGASSQPELPAEPRCAAPPRPATNDDVVLEAVFPKVGVEDPVALVHPPGDDSLWYVVTKPGIIYVFENRSDADPSVFLDLSGAIAEGGEAGLLDLAFHPNYASNGRVFVSYTTPGGTAFLSRISSLTTTEGGMRADATTETVILDVDQPFSNHNGGDIGFGNDGLLYIGLGDGGSAGDPRGHAQNTDTLLGSMLRIDVDGGDPYAVPDDNPFANGGGAPELFAWGLRNPWRWNFDPQTGLLWAGDVGQHIWEEVNVVERGGNYGWNIREGEDCLGADTCQTDTLIAPRIQYRNTGDASVVAGLVYRGEQTPQLRDNFIYSDFYFGTIFAVPTAGGTARAVGAGARGIAAWAQGLAGELYGVNYFNGQIYKLVPAPTDSGPDRFPRLLSATGCINMADPSTPNPGVIAYEVNLPFWSDGATKQRFAALPEGTSLSLTPEGDLEAPAGTVLVKSFLRDGQPLETRLMVRHNDGGWAGYGYAWNAAGDEATFVEETRVEDGWTFPASRECLACHTRVGGRALGLVPEQLVGTATVQAWQAQQWLPSLPEVDALPAVDDDGAAVEARVRAYLHVNCSMCHQDKGTGGRASLDLRRDITLEASGLCGQPRAGSLGLESPRIVLPGAPEQSLLLARVRAEQNAQMPPFGRGASDEQAATLIEGWITGLDPQRCASQ